MSALLQFDVNVNMTFEVDEDNWSAYLDEAEGDEDEALYLLGQSLEGEEIQGYEGRAWVCSVDDISQL